MWVEEIVFVSMFGIMVIATVASLFWRRRALARTSLVCIPVACFIAVILFVSQLFFEYPESAIEWEDRINAFIGGILLSLFIGMFVSVLW